MWQWEEEHLRKIDSWKSQALRDVYFAIHRRFVTENLVKRQLRQFHGLQYDEGQKLEHKQDIIKELGENALLRVCEFLDINAGENATAEYMASKIIDIISFNNVAGSVEEANSSSGHESLVVLEQIENVDAEKLNNEIELCTKEKELINVNRQLNEAEVEAEDVPTQEIDKLNENMKILEMEVRVLQAKREALQSKKQVLNAKAKLVENTRPHSVQSATLKTSKSEKVIDWLRSQREESPQRNATSHKQDASLKNTISNMLARQTLSGKHLEFDGSSALAWQHFLNQFQTTSRECGFSNEDDVFRLSKALKGVAREKVELLLISAKEPSKIISILNNVYGGSENIALELMTKARKIGQVSELADFEEYNCAVQNISSALEFTENKLVDTQKLMAMMIERLSEHLLREWGTFLNEKGIRAANCDFYLFAEWTQKQADLAQDISFFKKVTQINNDSHVNTYQQQVLESDQRKPKGKTICSICNEEKHSLDKCNIFKKAEIRKRWDLANRHKACYCCLKFHKGQCSQREMCKIDNCEKFHHRLLHKRRMETAVPAPQAFSGCITEKKKGLLKMLPIQIHGPAGSKEIIAFLDEGSTTTIMDLKMAHEVGIQGAVHPFCFSWTGGVYRYEPTAEIASITISGSNNNEFTLKDVRLVNDLNLPTQQIDYEKLSKEIPFNLVNLNKLHNTQPMLLIGQRHANIITTRAVINPDENGPMLSKTKLGWVLHGPIGAVLSQTNFTCCHIDDEDLRQMVKNQFSLENFGVCIAKTDKTKSVEDQLALNKTKSSIMKINGKFQVNLPWRENNMRLPNSRPMAEQRLRCLERKLLRNKKTAEIYQREIDKLLQNGYARTIKNKEVLKSPKLWFLPHFAVLNPNKPGKVRLVFDAAAECSGTSLNKNLLTGPDWLTSIIGILIRFRLHPIAFVGDIKEMFNQVQISDDDAVAQCFLWRDLNTKIEPTIYQMKAMLFGINSSPFLAQFVKNHNAEMFKEEFPEAVKAIKENHYVDDYLDSSPTVEEAVKLIRSVIKIHAHAGFEIRQFISNNREVLQQIPANLRSEKTCMMFSDKAEAQQKVLGILWDAKKDVFRYSTNTMHRVNEELLKGETPPTKRKILAAVNSIYDPLGLVTPVTIKGRILMRDVWEAGILWDDVIKGELVKKWQQWLKELKTIESMQIPRCYTQYLQETHKIELHVFNDASSKAYSSAAYLRFCYRQGQDHKYDTQLVVSKARVSPLKHVTIPKLETLAAVMGCRLAETIQKELQIKIDERFFWTDSRTVLTWINSDKRMQAFVANRISEICEKTERSEWHWTSTSDNIADIITRENIPSHKLDRWFSGPIFLQENQANWVKADWQKNITHDTECMMLIKEYEQPLNSIINGASTFKKVVRSTGWIKRLINNLLTNRTALPKQSGNLDVVELQWALTKWYKIVQTECFPEDIKYIQSGKTSPNLRLTKYSTFLDENNVMRLAGRIERAKDLSTSTRNPILLDGSHKFTKLIIDNLHAEAHHTGIQVVVHKFKSQYWMPKMTSIIKKVIKECLWCRRRKAKPIQPKMGWLPKERFFTGEKPFNAVGVDYFGPFYTRDGRGKSTRYTKGFRKRYGVIFTCLTTRAIHVEIAHSLSTDSCIMAIRRMMSRRGEIKVIWSDNGTNFRGSARELLEALEELDEQMMKTSLAMKGIEWKFIPANAPNFGGSWERLVGCFKRAIESVLSVDANPNDETLLTMFCEAEHLVNSRPYILESDDPDDDIGICPNDILIQQKVTIHSPGKFDKYDSKEKRMWRVSQLLIEAFWKRFLKEYIPTLINRSKWNRNIENLKEGELVIMKDNIPRGEWPLGIILKVHPGEDGIVRVVDLQTAKNTYRRPVNKLCRLGLQRGDITDRADGVGVQH